MGGVAVRWCVTLAVIGVAVSCRGREKLGGDGPFGDKVAAAVPRIEEATGLKFKRPPKLETRSKAEVRTFLERTFKEGHVMRELQGMEVAYKKFGLLPDTMNLERLMVDLLTEQIVGYYDPKTKVLYVVDEAAEELIGITITHELVHALQDQYLNLDSIQQVARENDRSTAVQAVIEGQAVFEQMSIMLGNNLAAGLPGGWDRVRELIREQSSAMPKFAMAPLIVQETVIFPYLGGAEFVRVVKAKKKENVLMDLPTSTEQVLNPDRFLTGDRDPPVPVRLGAPRGGTEVYQNTLGAFETRLFLYQHLRDEPAAVRGAAGWGGDRYQVVRSAAGDGLAWVTVWDTAVEAGEFHDVLDRAVKARLQPKTQGALADGRSYPHGADRRVFIRTVDVKGKPGVIYMDLPNGMDVGVLDLAAVTIVP